MSSLPPSAFGPTVDVRLIYGPLLIGMYFNLILFGVLITQQLAYFQDARKDPLWMRALVWGIFIIETANAGFDMCIMFQPLILNYGGIPNDLPTLFVTTKESGGIWTTVMVPIVRKFMNVPMLYRPAEVWLIAAAVTDICIAVSLAIALARLLPALNVQL
ncbi:hypothetical protein B0H12DRAFT_1235453 [Mycena haematopus]|nr:hypothetical protein B0H12DRAFT_1235453 [Mycena haematopus]